MADLFKRYVLEIVVFFAGAAVMVFEIVWSRIIGPYFWTSLIIWTSIIGVILWSLSLWYYFWWKIADKKADYQNLSMIFLIAVGLLLVTFMIKEDVLIFLQQNIRSIKISGVISSIILFAPVSIILGIISPYAIKLKLKNLWNSWSEIGRLYAISTIWSIFWTFLSGFYLIPIFWTNNIFLIIVVVLLLLSVILHRGWIWKLQSFFWIIIFIMFITVHYNVIMNENNGIFDIDTTYNRVSISNIEYNWKITKIMWINNEFSSGMNLVWDDLAFDYTKFYDLASYFFPDFQNTLMIWGAGYSYPKYFLKKFPNKNIDVVEIDPGLTKIAKQHFNLKDDDNLLIIHEDARTFLNKNKKKYDVIYGDAYKSQFSIPYHLTTKEFIQKNYDTLTDEGLVILNIISSIDWEKSEFLRSEYYTYKTIFPQVYIFQVSPNHPEDTQNIVLVALKSTKSFDFTSDQPYLQSMLKFIWKLPIKEVENILTDDYAPVDYYINKEI